MNERLLPLSMWVHLALAALFQRGADAWRDRDDESGVDEAVTKMIWLAVGIGVAVAATTFFIGVFETAKSNVPDPTAPLP